MEESNFSKCFLTDIFNGEEGKTFTQSDIKDMIIAA
jgi:hypothetical protein